jgi:hypothetical protein
MEIRIETPEEQALHGDIFLSVRIGEIQKQSRFANNRTFRFPEVTDSKANFGRLELFRRIGHVTLNFDQMTNGELQDCEVHLEPAAANEPGSVNLKLSYSTAKAPEITKGASNEKKTRAKARMDAAQKYLNEHKLEELLAETMREVIHSKPENPRKFIADRILSAPEPDFVKPPLMSTIPAPASPAPAVVVGSFSDYYIAHFQSIDDDAMLKLYGKFPVVRPAPAVVLSRELELSAIPQDIRAPAKKGCSSLDNFGEYFRTNVLTVDEAAMKGLYSKFPQPERPKALVPTKKGVSSLDDIGAYLQANVLTVDETALKGLYSKFPPVARPKAVILPPPASKVQFSALPSVGSWLQRAPVRQVQVAATSLVAAPAPVTSKPAAQVTSEPKPAFSLRPSVGSWLILKPPSAAVSIVAAPTESKPKSSSSASADSAVYVAPGRNPRFRFLPSVGGWYSPITPHEGVSTSASTPTKSTATEVLVKELSVPSASSTAPAFNLRPSVGSWLMMTPPKSIAQVAAPIPAPAAAAPTVSSSPSAPASPKPKFALTPSEGSWLQMRPPQVVVTSTVKVGCSDPTKFTEYFQANINSVSNDYFNRLYASFPAVPRPVVPLATPVSPNKKTLELVENVVHHAVNLETIEIQDHTQAVELITAFQAVLDEKEETIKELRRQLDAKRAQAS